MAQLRALEVAGVRVWLFSCVLLEFIQPTAYTKFEVMQVADNNVSARQRRCPHWRRIDTKGASLR